MTILRFLKYLFLVLVAVALVTLAMANREPVVLRLLPDDLATFSGLGRQIELPLFLVILGGVAVGVLVGFVWEWLREHRYRAEAARKAREVERLRREAEARQSAPASQQDEVLALIEEPRRRTG
ncbi:MAG: lipopolysaccharide assembly protein LapA domain-containing protein [Gemmobacter sp.]